MPWNRFRIPVLAAAVVFLMGSPAFAQSGSVRALGVVPGQETKTNLQPGSGSGLAILSQLDINAANGTTQAGIQALDLYVNHVVRLYTRLTLPLASAQAKTGATGFPNSTAAGLLDPYGGVLNISAGAYKQLVQTVNHKDSDHGLFLDARFGLKLLEMPGQTDKAPSVAGAAVTPFYSGAAMIKFVHELYTDGGQKDVAGGVEIGVGFVGNYAVDPSVSSAFKDGQTARWTRGVRVDILINLPGLAGINFSWNPTAAGSAAFGKNFVVGLKLFNQNPAVGKNN